MQARYVCRNVCSCRHAVTTRMQLLSGTALIITIALALVADGLPDTNRQVTTGKCSPCPFDFPAC